ncbi:ubinuclein-2a isoform X2 [Megalops cyprinoides]|uniref:ubinuclein-2a isoform X2 n=1 Tax=Megalops cyprinoides TaxID=118141 RepID=UPI0018649313|nr:ubinuclein-2a isoform X2 [Megalops cyprinoides]
MAEPRKVPFVTLTAFPAGPASEPRKRRQEDEADISLEGSAAAGATATGAGGGGLFGKTSDEDNGETRGITVRLNLSLSEPSDQASAEFNYSELVQSILVKKAPQGLTPACDPNDPFADEERERQEVEALAKKFESKYGSSGKKKRKDRMQDLIDIGFGYDESDPFIDNSEAYDELVPASLTTKLGGFYINTGTLQFRAASESEGEDGGKDGKPHRKLKDGEEPVIKKRKRKEGSGAEEKKPRKNRVPKQGVTALNIHRPEKKKRKKLMKDSLSLAAMIRRFTREKEKARKEFGAGANPPHNSGGPSAPAANNALHNSHLHPQSVNSDISMADLTADPAVMSLLGSTSESELQDLLGDLDFSLLDSSPQSSSPAQRENGLPGAGGLPGQKVGAGALGRGPGVLGAGGGLLTPPPLPDGLPAPLTKRIEDLRAASRQFDQEGRKKFFTLDMNNILLDIELQVQEQPAVVRSAVYSHLEAFVPCNKEALLKRLKKLSLNIQDDRLRTPLLKLKLAVCSVMPEQIARYNMDCIAKAAKQQSEEGEKNGSEEEDEEKPGKRVMGPRKKFVWDDKLRTLLCNLVRVKLGCYELESQGSLSAEDYLKAFMENEVKPLWPKGWMQARMLFKESRAVHSHLTGNSLAKKKIVPTQKAKAKEGAWVQRPTPSAAATPSPAPAVQRPPSSPSETICLSDSLDEELTAPSLDSIANALALLSSVAKGLVQNDSPPSPPGPHTPKMTTSTPATTPSVPHYVPSASHPLSGKKEASAVSVANMSTPSTSPSSSSSPSSTARSEGFGMMKGGGVMAQAQRHSLTPAHRPGVPGMNKLSLSNSPSPPKPRPPPTASPLLPPQQKSFCSPGVKPTATAPTSGLVKGANKASGGNGGSSSATGGSSVAMSPQSRLNSHPPQLNPKSPQTPRMPHCPSPGPSSSHPQSKPHQHHQSNFITPMQATLTKSSHSNNPPIIKLTPRPLAPTPPPSSSPSTSPSPSLPPHSRPQQIQNAHQYSPKNPSFRPPFSVQGGSVKAGPSSYSPAGGQKTSLHSSSGGGGGGGSSSSGTSASPTSTSSISSRPTSSPSPSSISASHGQRQRPAGGASQGAKPVVSRAPVSAIPTPPVTSQLSQVSSAGGNLLGAAPPSLPLGFGMLGGLVPVSLPFQFPPLLNFTPPGAPGGSGMGAAASNNSGYSLAQSESPQGAGVSVHSHYSSTQTEAPHKH